MAFLARHGNVQPDEFGRMTPARTRELYRGVAKLRDDDWNGYLELALQHAKMMAMLAGRS